MNADERRFAAKSYRASSAFILWLTLFSLSAAPRWNIQFLYDRADSNFAIEDLQCPTARHCVAAGLIDDKKGHQQGAVVVTGDGGLHWSQYEVKERPLSLFFLNDEPGLDGHRSRTLVHVEGGRAWSKVQSRKGILQAWFLDANHGYIAGLKGLGAGDYRRRQDVGQVGSGRSSSRRASLDYDIIAFQGTARHHRWDARSIRATLSRTPGPGVVRPVEK
jgi:hypothetical protein